MTAESNAIDALARNLPGSLIALDFDGTLSPIVKDPQAARPEPGVIAVLARLAEHGARIAIVTGRDALTVLRLGGLAEIPGVAISGLHGAEIWREDHLSTIDEPAGLAQLRETLPPLLPPGVWLEDKRLSLVLHTRRTADPEQALAELNRDIPQRVSEQGLEAHPGKQVLEIRIPGLSKATALRELLEPETSAALFAGDDLGDLPAVAELREWSGRTGRPGCTIAVGEVDELRRATHLQLGSPAELAALLQGLLPS